MKRLALVALVLLAACSTQQKVQSVAIVTDTTIERKIIIISADGKKCTIPVINMQDTTTFKKDQLVFCYWSDASGRY